MRKFYGPPIPGSISPVPATEEMTEPVGIKDGQLWTKGPDGGLEERVETLETDVGNLQETATEHGTAINNLEIDMTDAENDISGLQNRMTAAESNIGSNAQAIGQLEFDVSQAKTDIVGLGLSKLDKPTNEGETGDVIVKTANGTEYQAVAPFNPNGTYPNVTVGKAISAKSLENVSEDSGATQTEPFFFQATATANGTAETPTAPVFNLKSIRGNTIVYNQLVDGVTQTYPTISGHVYWFKHDPLVSLVTSTGTDINVPTPQSDKLVDLTRWFNGSIPQAILDDPSVFPINYYDDELTYSAGELKNCSCTEFKTVGFNQLDLANCYNSSFFSYNDGKLTNVNTDTRTEFRPNIWGYKGSTPVIAYQVKNASIGKDHMTFNTGNYDIDTILLKHDGSQRDLILFSQTGKYLRNTTYCLSFNVLSNNPTANGGLVVDEINLNLSWDDERNGEYVPYVKHTYPLVWSGKSAGETYDERLPDGTEIANVIQYSVPSENVSAISASDGIYDVRVYDAFTPSANLERVRFVACNYFAPATSISTSNMTDLSVMLAEDSGSTLIIFRDSSCTTLASFVAKYPNIIVNYRAKTPTTSEGTPFTSEIEGDDYGTMSFDSVVPVGNEFFYPADYALFIDDLGSYTGYDVSKLMLKTDNVVPSSPTSDGTYVLKCVVSGGTPTYSWIAET